jgi:Domain of unknown function (DUF3367).
VSSRPGWLLSLGGYLGFGLLVYLPLMLMHPGRVAADTKSYLYLDPGRLLGRVGSLWDPNIGLGTVSHQSIGYLFPLGPFYWVTEQLLGVPAWVAQRIWLGTLLVGAGLGVRYLLRTLGVRGPGVPVAVLAFALSPYALEFSARLSVLLGPWAALPWLLAFMIRALRVGGWKYPALFALTVQLVGGVNATALLYALIGPAVWFPYAVWIRREATLREAWAVAWRTGLLTIVTSLWWASGLFIEGRYGLGILRFTESLEVVSATSTATEILRGLGYWFFYGGDRQGPWNDAVLDFARIPWLIMASFLVPTLSLLAAGVVRWRDRAFFVLIAFLGLVIAVAASPFHDPAAVGSLFKAFATSSTAGFALRSTARAVPLISLAFAVLLGVGITAAWESLQRTGRGWIGIVAAVLVGVLCIANAPGLWNGRYYSKYLERSDPVPAYWTQALAALDARGPETRVLALPGADFAAYRWGDTIDPIEPGLMDRPYVARELVPWGGEASTNLLIALDRRLQDRLLEPNAIAPIARLMGVGDVLLRMDLLTDQFALVSAKSLWDDLTKWGLPRGLGPAKTFGTKIPGHLLAPDLGDASKPPLPEPKPVVILPVKHPVPIVRAKSGSDPLVVDGDGEGLVDAAAAGVLDGSRLVISSPTFDGRPAALRREVERGAVLVVTDSNRRRGMRWAGMRDNYGYTEQAGETPLKSDLLDQRLEVFPDSTDRSKTVTELRGVRAVRATSYGTPAFGFAPEGRPSRALDGDPQTAWEVGAGLTKVAKERLQIDLERPIRTDRIGLLQANKGARGRWITRVGLRFDGGPLIERPLAVSSRSRKGQVLTFPERTFSRVEIQIEGTVGYQPGKVPTELARRRKSGVGFAEIALRDVAPNSKPVRVQEVDRMPVDLLSAIGTKSAAHPLALLMTPTFSDFRRRFVIPTARSFVLAGEMRLNSNAHDDAIDFVLGIPGARDGGITVVSTETGGNPAARASAAFDGDPTTAWNSRTRDLVGEGFRLTLPNPITLDQLDLQLVADGRHSLPTQLRIRAGDGTTRVIDIPAGTVANGLSAAHVAFSALQGDHFAITLTGVRPLLIHSSDGGSITLPVGIAEMGIPGVRRASTPAHMPNDCVARQLDIDGTPIPVRVTGSTADALQGRALPFTPCDPSTTVQLGAGSHVVAGRTKRADGLAFGRMSLTSGAGGGAAPVASFANPTAAAADAKQLPRVSIVHHGRTSMQLRTSGGRGPFWIVLGQSLNEGWHATIDGHDLGPPQLVDGYANGWRVTPSARGGATTINLQWTPQQYVKWAILASLAGVLGCFGILIVVGVRRRRRVATVAPVGRAADERAPEARLERVFRSDGVSPGLAVTMLAAVAAAGVTSVLVRPWLGLLAGVIVLGALHQPKIRGLLRLLPALLAGLVGAYVAWGQLRHNYPPNFDWPVYFESARNVGWLVMVFLAADVFVGRLRHPRAGRSDPSAVGDGPDGSADEMLGATGQT